MTTKLQKVIDALHAANPETTVLVAHGTPTRANSGDIYRYEILYPHHLLVALGDRYALDGTGNLLFLTTEGTWRKKCVFNLKDPLISQLEADPQLLDRVYEILIGGLIKET